MPPSPEAVDRPCPPVLGRAVAIALLLLFLMVAIGVVWVWWHAQREKAWRDSINAQQPLVPTNRY